MKTDNIELIKHLKNLNLKQEIIHSSVSFQSKPSINSDKPKEERSDLLFDLEEEIRSGDDTIWRMWR